MKINVVFGQFSIINTLLLIFLLFSTASSFSAEKPKMDLIIGKSESNASASYLWTGLKIELPKGWKTYWKWSQDVGKPLSIRWDGSSNISDAHILWPTPEEMDVLGFQVYGYHDTLVFPIKIILEDNHRPVKLNLKANILLCDESTCNDVTKQFSYDSSDLNDKNIKDPTLVELYANKVPVSKDLSTLKDVNTSIYQDKNQYYYNISFKGSTNGSDTKAFIIPDEKIKLAGMSQSSHNNGLINIKIPLIIENESALADQALKFIVVLSNSNSNVEYVDYKPVHTSTLSFSKMMWVLLCGFLGGIILNFMPCILPILMLKALEVLNSNPEDIINSRVSYIVSALGILFSFMLFATITIIVSQLGHAATWGMHYQNPIFVFAMTAILVILACNLLGFYEISLPAFLVLSNEAKGNVGHFINGIIITFLAIPCSAPFLGTAASYGLSQPPLISLLVFFSIGLGFSLPYLILATSPALLKKVLPKPGMWMVTLKHVVGYTLIAVAIWLLWVLSGMISKTEVLIISAILTTIFISLLLIRYKPDWIKNTVWGSMAVCLITVGATLHGQEPVIEHPTQSSHWVAFEPNKIQSHLDAKKIIFIDFTAKWCITCKFNENMVLESSEVSSALADKNIVAMKADWTNPDPTISRFLKAYNQFAIPCYIVFSPDYPQGKVLSTILTKNEVLKSIKRG